MSAVLGPGNKSSPVVVGADLCIRRVHGDSFPMDLYNVCFAFPLEMENGVLNIKALSL